MPPSNKTISPTMECLFIVRSGALVILMETLFVVGVGYGLRVGINPAILFALLAILSFAFVWFARGWLFYLGRLKTND